jgi:hypothetical protein
MRNSLVVKIVVLACVLTSFERIANGQSGQGWRVSVLLPAQAPNEKPVASGIWVGLRNGHDKAKLICITGWSIQIRPQDQGPSAAGSPHSCRAPLTSSLVLPGESTFDFVEITPERLGSPDSKVDIKLFAIEADASSRAGLRKETLEWSGTVKEAVDAARRLDK